MPLFYALWIPDLSMQLLLRIFESQLETGTPYMLYKCHADRKSNQQNLGTIHNSIVYGVIECTSAHHLTKSQFATLPRSLASVVMLPAKSTTSRACT